VDLWRVDVGLEPMAWFAEEARADAFADGLRARGELGVRVRPVEVREIESPSGVARRMHQDWLASRRSARA
jgi:hypothetical protein